jgi:hypothetical protein
LLLSLFPSLCISGMCLILETGCVICEPSLDFDRQAVRSASMKSPGMTEGPMTIALATAGE